MRTSKLSGAAPPVPAPVSTRTWRAVQPRRRASRRERGDSRGRRGSSGRRSRLWCRRPGEKHKITKGQCHLVKTSQHYQAFWTKKKPCNDFIIDFNLRYFFFSFQFLLNLLQSDETSTWCSEHSGTVTAFLLSSTRLLKWGGWGLSASLKSTFNVVVEAINSLESFFRAWFPLQLWGFERVTFRRWEDTATGFFQPYLEKVPVVNCTRLRTLLKCY